MKCYEKRAYSSKEEADKVAKYQMAIDSKTPDLTTYNCPLCQKWHLTKA
jgi:hypothetical protein